MELYLVGGPFDGDVIDLNDDDSSDEKGVGLTDASSDEAGPDYIVIPVVREGNGTRYVLNSLYVKAENGNFYFKETKKDESFTVPATRTGDS